MNVPTPIIDTALDPRARRGRIQRLARSRRQGGMSMFGWIMTLMAVAFALNIGLALVPHYMEYRTIQSVVDSVSPEVWRNPSKKRMLETVDKRLKVNNVRSLKSTDVLEIERTQAVTRVKLDYEVREHIIGNIDAVLVFNKEYEY